MPEVTVKYKSEKSLQFLKDVSKYFDFEIISISKKAINSKENISKKEATKKMPGNK